MKDKTLEIVKSALAGAEDNLYRANMQFGNMSARQLAEKYGQSEQTCGEMLEGCQTRKAELERCINWVISAT